MTIMFNVMFNALSNVMSNYALKESIILFNN